MVSDLLVDTQLALGEAGIVFSNIAKPAPNAQFCLAGGSNAGA